MAVRKVWVKRPGASATLVPVHENDLVDDVRDMILKKYANSLGRSYDAPDVTFRIIARRTSSSSGASPGVERVLGPEEHLIRLLDVYYPGGQTVEEALVIDVPTPLRRTPRPSPRSSSQLQFYAEDLRPVASGEYFPSMPAMPSPHLPGAAGSVSSASGQNGATHPHNALAMSSILAPGHIPNLPSPGSGRPRGPAHARPRAARTQTSSPTLVAGNPNNPADGNLSPCSSAYAPGRS